MSKQHYRSHAEMQEILSRGETILYHPPGDKTGEGSMVVTRATAHLLPSAAELAQGDAGAEQAERDRLDAEIARLAAQRALLSHAGGQQQPVDRTAGAGTNSAPNADADPAGGTGKGSKKTDGAPDPPKGAGA